MTTATNLVAERVATLPITQADRREALAYVASGEAFAQIFLSMAKWLEASPSLKPSYQE